MTHDSSRPHPGAASRELVPFGASSGYRLATGEPDIRGWHLVGTGGAPLGTIEELLIDPAADVVRAVVLAVGKSERRVVVPMDHIRIDVARRSADSDETPATIAALPDFGPARRQAAADVRAAAPADRAAHPGVTVERAANGEEVIKVPIVEEQLVVERRPVVKEVVVIRKHAVQDARVVEADLRKERLEVERRDLDAGR